MKKRFQIILGIILGCILVCILVPVSILSASMNRIWNENPGGIWLSGYYLNYDPNPAYFPDYEMTCTITSCVEHIPLSKEINIPESIHAYRVTSIGYEAFSNSSMTSITIPNGVTSINVRAFDRCRNLTSVTIPDSVESIGASAFNFCVNLTSIALPDSIKSIGNQAFLNCDSLTNITIPDSVTCIANGVFYSCSSLTNITIPSSVKSIGDEAFEGCTALTSITFEGTVAQWDAISFGNEWRNNVPATEVICSDGIVTLN